MQPVSAEQWRFVATGNMTLAVVAADGLCILTVDMLRQKTMAAGLAGARLARACNDLTLLAAAPALVRGEPPPPLPHPDAGLSPVPWRVDYDPARRRVQVFAATGTSIAARTFPRSISDGAVMAIVETLHDGLRRP